MPAGAHHPQAGSKGAGKIEDVLERAAIDHAGEADEQLGWGRLVQIVEDGRAFVGGGIHRFRRAASEMREESIGVLLACEIYPGGALDPGRLRAREFHRLPAKRESRAEIDAERAAAEQEFGGADIQAHACAGLERFRQLEAR